MNTLSQVTPNSTGYVTIPDALALDCIWAHAYNETAASDAERVVLIKAVLSAAGRPMDFLGLWEERQ